ncbi:hypothetical protein VP01_210g17 [Puccinia sorghi]|uniref:Uncharacterized protein n=1 Tax=Puccinia sorghi TaxID=27349 RepID=A0A0L6VA51_9BASI|nr:hypothetical protein VP01_210g17 [Puccinia sorghi]
MRWMIEAVIDSVLPSKSQPVVPNAGLIRAMDLSFLGLLLTLLGLLLITQGNLHVLALMLVALCLWTSVRWCVPKIFIISVIFSLRFNRHMLITHSPFLFSFFVWLCIRFVAELARMNHLNKPVDLSIPDSLSHNDPQLSSSTPSALNKLKSN